MELRGPADALGERYRVERELERGPIATAYLVRDEKLQRHLTLKILHPELAAAVDGDRFRRGIAIAARLDHPNILSLHDSGELDGRQYYTTSYIEGETLRQRLEREAQLPVSDAVRITQAIAGALDLRAPFGTGAPGRHAGERPLGA